MKTIVFWVRIDVSLFTGTTWWPFPARNSAERQWSSLVCREARNLFMELEWKARGTTHVHAKPSMSIKALVPPWLQMRRRRK